MHSNEGTSLSLLESLLSNCVISRASDIHLTCMEYPVFRVDGELVSNTQLSIMTPELLEQILEELLSDEQRIRLEAQRSLDMGYSSKAGKRFRINVYFERGRVAMAFRFLDDTFYSLEELRLPKQIRMFTQLKDGLVLVTGATGSGKSTTIASLMNEINQQRACHILTIEDPIEFLYTNETAMVHQREIGSDVVSFSQAIRAALREDPDVILLGEMRDTDTIRSALMAAETGHLVFSTLHSNDAVGVIDRLVGAFPGEEQDGIRQQLSLVLRGIVTQQLVKLNADIGRLPVNEVLIIDTAVANLIRLHKPEQIRSSMETGRAQGNQTLEMALVECVKQRFITKDQALQLTHRKLVLEQLFQTMLGDNSRHQVQL